MPFIQFLSLFILLSINLNSYASDIPSEDLRHCFYLTKTEMVEQSPLHKCLREKWLHSMTPLKYKENVMDLYARTAIKKILNLGAGSNLSYQKLSRILNHDHCIIDSDIIYKNNQLSHCPYSKLHLDHRKPFSDELKDFDLITMSAGLCFCDKKSVYSCGGIKKDQKDLSAFFARVIRSLNKENIHSVATIETPRCNKKFTNIVLESAKEALRKNDYFDYRIALGPNKGLSGIIFVHTQLLDCLEKPNKQNFSEK